MDTHVHLVSPPGTCDMEVAIADALRAMDTLGIGKSVLLPPPNPSDTCDAAELGSVVGRAPDRLAFAAGGGSLNAMIHATPADTVTDEVAAAFEARAAQIVESGAAAFGELAALHISFAPSHPFEAAPADHPLFLLLADVAARNGLPIDLHMEAVVEDLPFGDEQLPANAVRPTRNPPQLAATLPAFERLLAHNRAARIVWAHAGADPVGQRSAALTRGLLAAHENLFIQLRVLPPGAYPHTVLVQSGPSAPTTPPAIDPEWLALLRAFPDRAVLGSDRFYHPPGVGQPFVTSVDATTQERLDRLYANFLAALPPDLAGAIASENAARIYRFG
ncbi:MAG TPA: amidohydrolase family protein [Chloroflexota bacterium]|nr:amidohydrolase family protein [Chloroflexota bacterium]